MIAAYLAAERDLGRIAADADVDTLAAMLIGTTHLRHAGATPHPTPAPSAASSPPSSPPPAACPCDAVKLSPGLAGLSRGRAPRRVCAGAGRTGAA